jgi:hypothetical protein
LLSTGPAHVSSNASIQKIGPFSGNFKVNPFDGLFIILGTEMIKRSANHVPVYSKIMASIDGLHLRTRTVALCPDPKLEEK